MSKEEKSFDIVGGFNRSDGKVARTRSKKSASTTVLTNWNDMEACGMSRQSVENAFKRHFDCAPDQVHLNDDFCRHYGWLSYNDIGKVKYFDVKVVPKSKLAAQRRLENSSDSPVTHTVCLKTTDQESATVHITEASSISMEASIAIGAPELGIGGNFSESFSITNEVGSSSTIATSVEISDTLEVTLPPHSKRDVSLEITWDERQEDFEIPVSIQEWGMTGAQFPRRVQGHYHWGFHHSKRFEPPFTSKLTGSLVASLNSTGTVVVGTVEAA